MKQLSRKFRAEHSKELDAYAESVKYFREENYAAIAEIFENGKKN